MSALYVARDPTDVSPLGLNLRHAELKPLEVAFDQLLLKVRQGLARERSFVPDAAHELRTPLAVITAQAHAVAGTRGAQQLDARSALEAAVQRTSHLIHQLLTLSSIENVERAQVRSVDLVELTREVLVARSMQADARGVVLSLDSPDSLRGAVSAESNCPSGPRTGTRQLFTPYSALPARRGRRLRYNPC